MKFAGFEYDHVHVTEREPDGSWEDCSWASAVELARAVGQDCPPTRAEYEALRLASGDVSTPDSPGSNLWDVERGMNARYGWSGSIATGVGNLTVGRVAIVTGKMGVWPAGSKWRRWDPGFTGPHAVAVFRVDGESRVWWCDPLAPSTFSGEWMPLTELTKFCASMGNWLMYGTIDERRAPVQATVTRTPYAGLANWRVAAGTTLRGYDPQRPGQVVKQVTFTMASVAQATADVFVAWTGVDPAPIPKGGPFLEVANGAFAGLLIVKALVTVTPPPAPPDPTPYDAEDLAAAKAEGEHKGWNEALAVAADAVADIPEK